jgi:serine/threonine protein kinase
VQLIDITKTSKHLYYITERLQTSLSSLLWRKREQTLQISEAEGIRIVVELLKCLKGFEENSIMHSDIKPENVLMDSVELTPAT